jgi:hypothetical protein
VTARLKDDLGSLPDVVTGSFFLGLGDLGSSAEGKVFTVLDSGEGS